MSSELIDDPTRTALAVFAHPDDSDLSCGGTLATWVDKGCTVHVVVCALGDKGSMESGIDTEALSNERLTEIERGASALGVTSFERLGYRDGELEDNVELRRELVRIIRTMRPEALVCPDPTAVFFGEHYYNHRDHRVVGFAALDAASPAAASPLYFPELGAPFSVQVAYLSGSLEANVSVDISSAIDKKIEAVLSHKSQLGSEAEVYKELVLDRARQVGRAVGVAYAETFRRIRFAH